MNKYFIYGLIAGYSLCMLTGYVLLLIDRKRDKKRKIDTKQHK